MPSPAADYSMLLHSIEGKLSSLIPPSSGKDHRKRLRYSAGLSPPFEAASAGGARSSDIDLSRSPFGASSVLCDELKLQNERLTELLSETKDEINSLKDKYNRQIAFMEQENASLKRLAEERASKYYEEKKKWQQKLRSLEFESKPSSSAASTASAAALRATAAAAPSDKEKWAALEQSVLSKYEELKRSTLKNTDLEATIKKLEQELQSNRSNGGTSGQSKEEIVELHDLRKRYSDLEVVHRRKSREMERLEQKLKNQALVEEELAAANARLKLLQNTVDSIQGLETSCNMLANEKKQWTALFRDILTESDGLDLVQSSAAVDVTPLAVFRALGSYQMRSALLLKAKGEGETALADQRSAIVRLEAALAQSEASRSQAVAEQGRLESRMKINQQQTKLFQDEVATLRSVVQSYDAEFKIGKPDVDKVLAKKDEVIAQLRRDVDDIRPRLLERLSGDESALGHRDEEAGSAAAEIVWLRAQLADLQSRHAELSHVTRMDYIPRRTRVLHLAGNPCSAHGLSSPAESSVPMEQLKRLRAEARQGGARRDTAFEAAATCASSSSSGAADSGKLNQRLKEMFKERITAFREAVYLLTGYKVDLYSAEQSSGGHPRLRLRSMYAEDPDDSLLFQWRDGALELIETPFAAKLDQKLFAYLTTCNSVPAFLSNVTIDLFDNQTFVYPVKKNSSICK